MNSAGFGGQKKGFKISFRPSRCLIRCGHHIAQRNDQRVESNSEK